MQKALTLVQAHNAIRTLCGLRKSHNPYFKDNDLNIVLARIGYSKRNLPSWWIQTVAGPNHPGKPNHLAILRALQGIEDQKEAKKLKPTKKKKFTTLKHVSKWVLTLIKDHCPPNLDSFDIKENENSWTIVLEIKK